ncbi:MAG TPA: helix-turn-helix domain-containing protein [bacterium]|nr:helix-turn-helix domain-containing protein [bacterium]HQN74122.1 helix-turn-helix domain-containing protein [bacterium]
MKNHKGMKPQDVAILLFICQYFDGVYKVSEIADALKISQSEISESINRSNIAKLIEAKSKAVFRHGFYEFLVYGLKFVFPAIPGHIVRGVPTAHSGPPLNKFITSDSDQFVWSCSKGSMRGMSIEPLYRTMPLVYEQFPEYYELLCLVDALRIGRSREVVLAREILSERLLKNGG